METKALISFAVTAKLICAFAFAYAKCWFARDAAPMTVSPQQENLFSGIPTRSDRKPSCMTTMMARGLTILGSKDRCSIKKQSEGGAKQKYLYGIIC